MCELNHWAMGPAPPYFLHIMWIIICSVAQGIKEVSPIHLFSRWGSTRSLATWLTCGASSRKQENLKGLIGQCFCCDVLSPAFYNSYGIFISYVISISGGERAAEYTDVDPEAFIYISTFSSQYSRSPFCVPLPKAITLRTSVFMDSFYLFLTFI